MENTTITMSGGCTLLGSSSGLRAFVDAWRDRGFRIDTATGLEHRTSVHNSMIATQVAAQAGGYVAAKPAAPPRGEPR